MIVATAAALMLLASPTSPVSQSQPPAAAQPATIGLSIPAMTGFLTAQGLTVGPLEQDGQRRFVSVTDGPVRWVLFFQSCEGDVCSDLQFSFGFANAGVTMDGVNRWNRERRFLKAFFEPGATPQAPAAAATQFDVLINGVQGVEQLSDPLSVWRSSILEFPAVVISPPPAA
ncbi:YbjN domain-containing protein [Brevundimonas variabilis]|uniref:Sensory transduction regulator n=1 Tax=Brevundimonas variabilis TaxID=74312 RepID=A0A7W9CG84_9CAUL|nr:YbjN domain-containing protein [Brevundimonas variabilis]MBB5745074.1 hypothetical protein [Brevundimonas variabilis]